MKEGKILSEPKVKVEFSLEGLNLDPEYVTKKIGLKPHIFYKKGEIAQNHKPYKQGCWSIIVPYEVSYDISVQVEKLFKMIRDKKEIILEVKKMYKGDVILSVVIEVENQTIPGVTFENQHITLLAELEADMDVDILLIS
ncbi:DUF4279 domain-containing protein [Candidatus Enterococcus murrayae]|uniref:DUF4279 domain-containing protein n=1 Tax=Candidatus Enterococcus murrayae TaxID=2815321 RepID=A0ABS3HI94_9ENTE|nr:DUF4279 domain-containing protein [Enterococcus sp. MJM16]MBO0453177.1 DUF4279 domain-containing protein [Enterococcus sp. MJM16]